MILLGISIGTTRSGICVLDGDTIVERRTHNVYQPWSEKKLTKIINRYRRYVQKYGVNAIVVKVPAIKKHDDAIRQIIEEIELLAQQHKCYFNLITKREMKFITKCHSTEELIRFVRFKYPDLTGYLDVESDGYYHKLYEAILAAYILQNRLYTRMLQNEQSDVQQS